MCRWLAAYVLLAAFWPSQARGQTLLDLLASIRQGGGWIDVSVREGRGNVLTPVLPTARMDVSGCFRVWGGHTGVWEFDIRDTQGDARLERAALPDEPVRFRHTTGSLAQLDVRVRWSEPRDTTLILWVGLRTPTGVRDPCEPVYGSPVPNTALNAGRRPPS